MAYTNAELQARYRTRRQEEREKLAERLSTWAYLCGNAHEFLTGDALACPGTTTLLNDLAVYAREMSETAESLRGKRA